MNKFPFTERGMNDAMNDGVFIGWSKQHSVYDEELVKMYQQWVQLIKQYKKYEYLYLLNKCDVPY